jgi:hypothetical protein
MLLKRKYITLAQYNLYLLWQQVTGQSNGGRRISGMRDTALREDTDFKGSDIQLPFCSIIYSVP